MSSTARQAFGTFVTPEQPPTVAFGAPTARRCSSPPVRTFTASAGVARVKSPTIRRPRLEDAKPPTPSPHKTRIASVLPPSSPAFTPNTCEARRTAVLLRGKKEACMLGVGWRFPSRKACGATSFQVEASSPTSCRSTLRCEEWVMAPNSLQPHCHALRSIGWRGKCFARSGRRTVRPGEMAGYLLGSRTTSAHNL